VGLRPGPEYEQIHQSTATSLLFNTINHDSTIAFTKMASSLTTRTVWLKLHPSARTFAERREVLRVLERFGEVTMFKSHKVALPTSTFKPRYIANNVQLIV